MALVNFKKGLLASLPSTYAEGTFYVTTDERAIYLDVSGSSRIRLGDFQEYATLDALKAVTNPSTTALYYVKDINCLAKYDGEKYVQINPDKGAIDIKVGGTAGEANGLTATYDEATRTITISMSKAFVTENEVEAKISAAIGDLDDYDTVKEYVDAKTDGIASDEALSAMGTRVGALETKVGEKAVSAQISEAVSAAKEELGEDITAAQEAAEAAQADVDELEGRVDDLEENDTKQDGRLDDLEEKITGLSGAMHFKGVVSTDPATIKDGYDNGDVVIYGNKEYVWNAAASAFVEFGDVTEEAGRISTLESEMDEAQSDIEALQEDSHEHENKGELDKVAEGDVTKWNTAAAKASTNESDISAIKDGEDIDSFADVEAALDEKQDKIAENTYDAYGEATKAEQNAKTYTDTALTWGSF